MNTEPSTATPRRVLVVDDHAGFRAAARLLLEADGYEIVGESGDGADALRAVEELRPDLVLLDVQLPDIDGFEVAERIAALGGELPQVVLVSSRDRADFGGLIEAAPVSGFVGKSVLTASALAEVIA